MPLAPTVVLWGLSWSLTGLAVILTGVRYWIRSNILKALHWDDAAHLLGLLCLLAQVSMNTAGDVAGTHAQWDVDYDGDDSARWEKLVSFSTRANFAANLLTWCCLYSIKAAFLLLYRQIFHISKPFMRVWWIVSIVVFATWCVLFVGSLVQCGDISNPNQEMRCICEHYTYQSGRANIYAYGTALNVATDLMIIALPLAMLKILKIRLKAKFGLAAIFCIAFIDVVFDVLRGCEFITTQRLAGGCELWMNLESAVAVIVSCLPSLVALSRTKRQGPSQRTYISRPLIMSDSAETYMTTVKAFESRTGSASAIDRSSLTSPI